jgi:hypothetical protein
MKTRGQQVGRTVLPSARASDARRPDNGNPIEPLSSTEVPMALRATQGHEDDVRQAFPPAQASNARLSSTERSETARIRNITSD